MDLGFGIIGGGSFSPAKASPSHYLSPSRGNYQDAAVQFTADDHERLAIADGDQTGLDIDTNDAYIGGQFCFDTLTAAQTLWSKLASDAGYELTANADGSLTVTFGDGTSTSGSSAASTVTTGTWYYISAYADRSGNLVVKVNGTTKITLDISARTSAVNSTAAFTVGAQPGGGQYADGRADSLMIFSAADLSGVADDIETWAYNSGSGRLCSEITDAQKTAWGAVSGWDQLEATGDRYDQWGENDLSQQFATKTTNGGFDSDTSDWTAVDANLSSVGSGQSGNCLQVENSGAAAGYAHQSYTTVIGKLYTLTVYHKNGTDTGKILIGTSAGDDTNHSGSALDDATWAQKTVTFRATATTTYVSLSLATAVASDTTLWDTVDFQASEILAAPGIARGRTADSNFAVELDGSNQYLSYSGTAFDPGTGDFGVCLAGYLDSFAADYATLFSAGDYGSNYVWGFVAEVNNRLYIHVEDSTDSGIFWSSYDVDWRPGEWHTVILNFNRDGNLECYFDGVRRTPGASGEDMSGQSATINPGVFRVGRVNSPPQYWHGRIDNIGFLPRLFTEAERDYMQNNGQWRQFAEIEEDMPDLASAFTGFWEFDDASSLGTDSTSNSNDLTPQNSPTQGEGVNYLAGEVSRVEDYSGNSRNATQTSPLASRPSWLDSGINGRDSWWFDGVDDDFELTSYDLTGGFVFNVTFQLDATASDDTLIGENGADNYIALTNDTTVTVQINGSSQTFTVGSMGTDKHMLTVTRDASDAVHVYLDDVDASEGAQSLAGTFTIERIGSHGSEYFGGQLGEITICDTAKTDAQVQQIEQYEANVYGVTI